MVILGVSVESRFQGWPRAPISAGHDGELVGGESPWHAESPSPDSGASRWNRLEISELSFGRL